MSRNSLKSYDHFWKMHASLTGSSANLVPRSIPLLSSRACWWVKEREWYLWVHFRDDTSCRSSDSCSWPTALLIISRWLLHPIAKAKKSAKTPFVESIVAEILLKLNIARGVMCKLWAQMWKWPILNFVLVRRGYFGKGYSAVVLLIHGLRVTKENHFIP